MLINRLETGFFRIAYATFPIAFREYRPRSYADAEAIEYFP